MLATWQIQTAQKLFKSANYFDGDFTSVIDSRTIAAANIIMRNMGANWAGWNNERRVIAAAQRVLNIQGHEAGFVDGLMGTNTLEAMRSFNGQKNPEITHTKKNPNGSAAWPKQADMEKFYGPAGSAKATQGKVQLPFPHFLAWSKTQKVNVISCHILCQDAFQFVFTESAKHYGEDLYRKLKLDLYGGCFNDRNIRGGSVKSTHAYGAAIDLNPEENQLRWNKKRASFAAPSYLPFWKIVESQGLVSLGRARDYDWMHFQAARL